ncbi:dynactin subunit 6 [Rhodnius prolixus]|uniref:Dynactin subunit 6 n=2 Tax=Rhodnius TaxID=13248 RepID=T1IFZ1_RHOPR
MSSSKDLRIGQGAVVCLDSKLVGSISIGPKSLLHPKSTIIAEGGPIIIGESNIFEEQSIVQHRVDIDKKDRPNTLMIGSNNVFEVGCTVLAKVIGDNNVFESKCYVGPDIEVGNGCIIGAGVKLTAKERLPDNIILTGTNYNRTIAADRPPPQTLQLDFLMKVLPNYHHLRKPKERPNVL